MKRIRNEKGLSILEVLAAMFIFGMVVSIAYTILFMSLSIYKNILIEGEMRSRGEALFSDIISELKDAIYVENGAAGDHLSIVYIKRSVDLERYLDQYEMRIYLEDTASSDVQVRNMETGDLIHSFDLGDRYKIKKGELTAIGENDAVSLLLVYGHRNTAELSRTELADMKIDSRIPLYRSD